jgi:hypothetical protein
MRLGRIKHIRHKVKEEGRKGITLTQTSLVPKEVPYFSINGNGSLVMACKCTGPSGSLFEVRVSIPQGAQELDFVPCRDLRNCACMLVVSAKQNGGGRL